MWLTLFFSFHISISHRGLLIRPCAPCLVTRALVKGGQCGSALTTRVANAMSSGMVAAMAMPTTLSPWRHARGCAVQGGSLHLWGWCQEGGHLEALQEQWRAVLVSSWHILSMIQIIHYLHKNLKTDGLILANLSTFLSWWLVFYNSLRWISSLQSS